MRKTSNLLCVVAALILVSPTMGKADCVTSCAGAPTINVSTLGVFEDTYDDTDCTGCTDDISDGCMGSYDVVDIVESDDPGQIEKAVMIIRSLGRSTTETLLATEWDDFLAAL